MSEQDRIYWLSMIDGRGNVRESDANENRDEVVAEKSAIERKHPNWTVRVKVR